MPLGHRHAPALDDHGLGVALTAADHLQLDAADGQRDQALYRQEPLPGFADLSPWFGDFRPSLFRPVLDVTDEGDTLEVTAEMPGMDKSDIEISVDEGVLVLKGEKKHRTEKREKGCYRLERSFGQFRRNIPLPADVDLENAEASFEKGILKIHFKKLAKTQKEAPKKIAIKT